MFVPMQRLETIYLIETTIYTWLALGFQGYTHKSYSKVKLHHYATIQSATIEVADEKNLMICKKLGEVVCMSGSQSMESQSCHSIGESEKRDGEGHDYYHILGYPIFIDFGRERQIVIGYPPFSTGGYTLLVWFLAPIP